MEEMETQSALAKTVAFKGETARSLKWRIDKFSDEHKGWLTYDFEAPSEGVVYDVAVFDVDSDADNQLAEVTSCRRMMRAKQIIVIDVADSEDNRIRAYDADVDAVISVPFSAEEFMHLLDNRMRRCGQKEGTVIGLYELGRLLFDVKSGVISYLGGSVRLPLQASRLLGCLCAHRGDVVSKTDLISVMTNGSGEMSDGVFRVQMAHVRKALRIDPTLRIDTLREAKGFRLL